MRTDRSALAAFTAYEEGRLEDALRFSRADLTQYILWYHRHTEPWLRSDPEAAQKLVDLDIDALSNILELLMRCCRCLSRDEEFALALDGVANLMDCERWHQRVVYYRTLDSMGDSWDEKLGRTKLRSLGDPNGIVDADVLQLYMDLFCEELTFSERSVLADRVIDRAVMPAQRLQYRAMKAVDLLLVGDSGGACKALSVAIDALRAECSDPTGTYAQFQLGRALWILGTEKEDPALLDEAEHILEQASQSDELTDAGKSLFCSHAGLCCLSKGDYKSARDWFRQSLSHEDVVEARLEVVRCFLAEGDSVAARAEFSNIDPHALTASVAVDYVLTLGKLALTTDDLMLRDQADKRLRACEPEHPYFKEIRDSLLLQLADSRGVPSTSTSAVACGDPRGVIGWLARYFVLQPNLFGVGINVNAILGKASAAHRAAADQSSDSEIANDT